MKPEDNVVIGGSTTTSSIGAVAKDGTSTMNAINIDDSNSSSDDDSVRVLDRKEAVATAASAASSSSPAPRRSGRERSSTTIQIDGHTVLKQNNYVVRGDEYIWGNNDVQVIEPKKKAAASTLSNNRKPRAPTQPKPQDISRMSHNNQIRTMTLQKQYRRRAFLVRHLDLLKPFCETKVLEELQQEQLDYMTSAATTVERENDELPVVTQQPSNITATLRDYQLQGLNFMVQMHHQNLSMILGDEMGLGKTLQTISLLTYLKEHEGITGPSLVICPLSVLSSWCNEISKWNPSLKYFRLHASQPEDQLKQKHELTVNATSYDIIVTTYEMAKIPLLSSLYARLHFHYLVLDEGHKIKGHTTQIAQAVRKIHTHNSLLLTGTPLQNNLVELWSLLNFLYPKLFTTLEPFEQAFNLSENVIDKGFLRQSQKLLDLFMLRRLKAQVETKIPPKLETKVYCPLSKTQVFWYKSLLLKDMGSLANCETEVEEQQEQEQKGQPTTTTTPANRHAVLKSLFMQLRKCCNHPFMFDGAEVDPEETSLEDLIAASGKLSVLDLLLQSLYQKGHRSVLFSQFTNVLDIIEDYCILRGWKYCRLDGSTDRAKRNYYIRRFNEQPTSPYFLFLVSTRSGGMGLNLQTADTCILYDSDWNPQQDIQAMGRVHRIGQTKTVHVYRLVSSGTIEERMLERAEKKLLLEMVNRESKTNPNGGESNEDENVRGLSSKELFDDIKFGSEAVFGTNTNHTLPTWEDIQTITDRKRKESDSTGKLQGDARKSAKEFNATKEFTQTQVFGGKDFKAIREEQQKKQKKAIPKNLDGISELWYQINKLGKKRHKKQRIVMVQGEGSGYGASHVPVLASNNYDLQNGESSVFSRELSHNNKNAFAVPKKKKTERDLMDNFDFCQICGDGGSIVCCPRCPCSVHLECVGLTKAFELANCTHHSCVTCKKNRQSAGGLLYPCHCCWKSYCEDCLPKEGVTFLERVERYDKMGYDSGSGKVIYINCSKECEQFAKREYGYIPPRNDKKSMQKDCPKPLDVSFNFGESIDIENEQEEVERAKLDELTSRTRSSRRTRNATRQNSQDSQAPSPKKIKVAETKDYFVCTLPSGPFGVSVEVNSSGKCTITSCKSFQTKLKPGDRIKTVNDVDFTSMKSATEAAQALQSFANQTKVVKAIPGPQRMTNYLEAITEAIVEFNDRDGTYLDQIRNYMQDRLPLDREWNNGLFYTTLQRNVKSGILIFNKGRYKLCPNLKKEKKQIHNHVSPASSQAINTTTAAHPNPLPSNPPTTTTNSAVMSSLQEYQNCAKIYDSIYGSKTSTRVQQLEGYLSTLVQAARKGYFIVSIPPGFALGATLGSSTAPCVVTHCESSQNKFKAGDIILNVNGIDVSKLKNVKKVMDVLNSFSSSTRTFKVIPGPIRGHSPYIDRIIEAIEDSCGRGCSSSFSEYLIKRYIQERLPCSSSWDNNSFRAALESGRKHNILRFKRSNEYELTAAFLQNNKNKNNATHRLKKKGEADAVQNMLKGSNNIGDSSNSTKTPSCTGEDVKESKMPETNPIAKDLSAIKVTPRKGCFFLSMPPGPLGVDIAWKNGNCVVIRCQKSQTKLQQGDIIVEVNDIDLCKINDGNEVISTLKEFSSATRTLTVCPGPNRGNITYIDRVIEAIDDLGGQTNFVSEGRIKSHIQERIPSCSSWDANSFMAALKLCTEGKMLLKTQKGEYQLTSGFRTKRGEEQMAVKSVLSATNNNTGKTNCTPQPSTANLPVQQSKEEAPQTNVVKRTNQQQHKENQRPLPPQNRPDYEVRFV